MRKRFYVSFIFIQILIFMIHNSAFAQSYQTFSSDLKRIENSIWKIGPFRISPMILFSLGYNSNIYRISAKESPISDYMARVAPQMNVYLPFRKFLLFNFSGTFSYVHYFEEKDLSGINYAYSVGLRLLVFRKFVVSGKSQKERDRRRYSSEFNAPIYRTDFNYLVSLFYETMRNTSFGFSGSIIKIYYDEYIIFEDNNEVEVSSALNRDVRTADVEFNYKILTEGLFFINGGFSDYHFRDKDSQWRNSYSYRISSGTRFPVLGRIRGTLSIGYKVFIPRSKEYKSFSGPFGDTSLYFRIRRFALRLQYIRDSRFSYSTTNVYFVDYRYGAGVSYYSTQFLRLDYSFMLGNATYPEEEEVALPGGGYESIKRKDVYQIHRIGLVFRIMNNTGISLTVDSWKRYSNIPDIARERIRFLIGLIYDF